MPLLIVVVFLLTVATVCGAWLAITRYARSTDAAKLRARLIPHSAEASDKRSARVALFEKDDHPTGQLLPKILEKLNLRVKLSLLSEQAGTKIDPIKFVQLCLACF